MSSVQNPYDIPWFIRILILALLQSPYKWGLKNPLYKTTRVLNTHIVFIPTSRFSHLVADPFPILKVLPSLLEVGPEIWHQFIVSCQKNKDFVGQPVFQYILFPGNDAYLGNDVDGE